MICRHAGTPPILCWPLSEDDLLDFFLVPVFVVNSFRSSKVESSCRCFSGPLPLLGPPSFIPGFWLKISHIVFLPWSFSPDQGSFRFSSFPPFHNIPLAGPHPLPPSLFSSPFVPPLSLLVFFCFFFFVEFRVSLRCTPF